MSHLHRYCSGAMLCAALMLSLAGNLLLSTSVNCAETDTTTWSASARQLYDTGWVDRLMVSPDNGVRLFNIDLFENDSPGGGQSNKGQSIDAIYGLHCARKILTIDDNRAHKASLYLFPQRNLKHPLTVEINGHTTTLENTQRKGWESVRWIEFPSEWLKKGKNIIDLSCPEAENADDGWIIALSRADEYAAGGGDPASVGDTSYKSTNGGKSWKQSPFGSDGDDRAEYCVRISLERFVKTGWLESPVIDLWRTDANDLIARMKTIQEFRLEITSDVPQGTEVQYSIRKGTSPGPFANEWEPYQIVGSGPNLSHTASGRDFNRRYVQFKAVLSTVDPLVSPRLISAHIEADFKESFPVPRHQNLYVRDVYNPPIQYSSVNWEWETWDRPELTKLKKQENLDAVIAGSRTQLEAQMKLLDYAKKRWRWTSPNPEYPGWDALSIVNRINKAGGGGMCIQQNLFFVGLCMTYGWQGRLIGVDGHEVCEVWNDEFAKWIYFDTFFPNHILCDIVTGTPLSYLEIHDRYLDYFYPDRPMNWATDYRYNSDMIKQLADKPSVIRSSLTYHDNDRNAYTGFIESRIMRILPRNNFYEKPFPRPLSHSGGGYFWQGYVSWYDERTPTRGQYSWYTNRPRDLWPDLNTVHIHTTQGYGNDRLFLEFETCTPNFSHFEVNVDDTGWEPAEERWSWLLVPGRNKVLVRAVSKLGVGGKPSHIELNHVVMPLNEWELYPEAQEE